MALKAHFQKQMRIARLHGELRRLNALARKHQKRARQIPADVVRLMDLASDRHILDFGAVEKLTVEALEMDAEADRMIARRTEIEIELASLTGLTHADTLKGPDHV